MSSFTLITLLHLNCLLLKINESYETLPKYDFKTDYKALELVKLHG